MVFPLLFWGSSLRNITVKLIKTLITVLLVAMFSFGYFFFFKRKRKFKRKAGKDNISSRRVRPKVFRRARQVLPP